MSAEKTIKAQARMTLKGGWLRAIAALIIALSVFGVSDCVMTIPAELVSDAFSDSIPINIAVTVFAFFCGFLISFFLSPFLNGYIRMYYRAATEGVYDFSDVFYYFTSNRYRRTLSLNLGFIVRMLLPALIAYSPVMIFTAMCEYLNISFPLYDLSVFILTILSTIITVLWSLRYFLVFTLSIEFEYMTPSQLFRSSKKYMSNHTGKVVRLILSFFPWLLLCMTILPILYVAPYLTQAMCISAKWITRTQMNFDN